MSSEAEPPAGLVAGKYRLNRLLGRGGMGAVWEGVHETLGTRVAVKFIDAEYAGSDDVRSRFVNEAKAAARLRSKHVVQVFDQGVGEDGRPYIVMEFLHGEPLDRRLDRQGKLDPEETARITLHVSRALARAHEQGIVHRDLKPENVFLVRDDEDQTELAKVVDFGIAKFTDPTGASSSSTRTGAVLGTPQYMSPEQARGLRTVDHRTDLWSLGVIVYRCLSGAMPFKGEAVGDLLVNICTSDPPTPSAVEPRVPAGFDAWVRRALAREPSDRFQSAAELSDALAAVCGAHDKIGAVSGATRVELPSAPSGPGAVTASPLETTPTIPTRSRGLLPLVAVFLGVLVTAVFGARAVMRPGAEPVVPASAAPSPPPVVASPGERAPEVTPVTSAAPVPSAKTEEPAAPRKGVRPRAVATPPPAVEAPPKKESPRPARPKDELGY
ncbi:MAG TPA: protein kinase [Polyangiaceae bacterium]|nr:protein kinase [Polyangiaceae bacterium]